MEVLHGLLVQFSSESLTPESLLESVYHGARDVESLNVGAASEDRDEETTVAAREFQYRPVGVAAESGVEAEVRIFRTQGVFEIVELTTLEV
jgi:hypothetical protein